MRPAPALETSARAAGAAVTELPATIELIRLSVPPPVTLPMPPPARPAVALVDVAVLLVIVQFWMVAGV